MQDSIGTLEIFNQVEALNKVPIWLEEMQLKAQFSERLNFKLDLVLNELLPNIIEYGYIDTNLHKIHIHLCQTIDFICLEVMDDGIAFNPFAKENFQPAVSLASATINGRGIHLIKSFSDQQNYERVAKQNKVSLYFRREPSEAN